MRTMESFNWHSRISPEAAVAEDREGCFAECKTDAEKHCASVESNLVLVLVGSPRSLQSMRRTNMMNTGNILVMRRFKNISKKNWSVLCGWNMWSKAIQAWWGLILRAAEPLCFPRFFAAYTMSQEIHCQLPLSTWCRPFAHKDTNDRETSTRKAICTTISLHHESVRVLMLQP